MLMFGQIMTMEHLIREDSVLNGYGLMIRMMCQIKDGWFQSYEITPEQFGFTRCEKSDLVGGEPQENAQITRDILSGKETGAKRNVILMNAGIAIYLGKEGITMEEGVAIAKEMIDSGKALEKLEEFIKETNA